MKNKIILISVLVIFMILVSVIGFKIGSKSNAPYTYAFLSSVPEDVDQNLNSSKMLFTFNADNKCIDCRIMFDFANEEAANKQLEACKTLEKSGSISNVNMNSNLLTYNTTMYNEQTKTEIMQNKLVGQNGNYIEM